jgi:dihydroorotase
MSSYNSQYKVNPPLRTEADRKALIAGIADGTIDCLASHHQAHEWDAKSIELVEASFGMNTISTMLPMLLQISEANIRIDKWIELLTSGPRKILQVPEPILQVGEIANLTIFSLEETTKIDSINFASKSQNSPLFNTEVKGKIVATICNSQITNRN